MAGPGPTSKFLIGGKPYRLPLPNSCGKTPWDTIRIVTPRVSVPIAPRLNSLDDDSTFGPVVAIYVQPCIINPNDPDTACGEPYTSSIGDLIARASIWLNVIRPGTGGTTQAVPNPFDIQVRMAADQISETIIQGTVTPTGYNENGLIVAFNGIQGTQIEIWGRIRNMEANPVAQPFDIALQFCVDKYQALGSSDVAGNFSFPVDVFPGRLFTPTALQFGP